MNIVARTTKPTKLPMRPAKIQISLGICPDWSDWVDAQADLSLRCPFVCFVIRQLKYSANIKGAKAQMAQGKKRWKVVSLHTAPS